MNETQTSGPCYDPPYDSPIEEIFAHNALKYVAEDASIETQFVVKTICGTFRLDFVIERQGRRLGIECDGHNFHDEHPDEWRDAMILGTGAVDAIYRLRGRDLFYHVEDLFFLMSRTDPAFFSPRGIIILAKLASDETKGYADDDHSVGTIVTYRMKPGEHRREPLYLEIHRRHRHYGTNKQPFWWVYWRQAKRFAGRVQNVDELIAIDKQWVEDRNAGKVVDVANCERCGFEMKWDQPFGGMDFKVWDGLIVCPTCYGALHEHAASSANEKAP